jgi:hypothetical protein
MQEAAVGILGDENATFAVQANSSPKRTEIIRPLPGKYANDDGVSATPSTVLPVPGSPEISRDMIHCRMRILLSVVVASLQSISARVRSSAARHHAIPGDRPTSLPYRRASPIDPSMSFRYSVQDGLMP